MSAMQAGRKRIVLHVDLDAFFVSVERVLDPSLCGKPVVVGGSAEGRGVVAAASYEARAFGVRSAMPMAQALRLCPQLVRVRGSRGVYGRASRAVFERLLRYTPLLEKVSVDEAYLDLTGCVQLREGGFATALRMREEIREALRLDLSVGIATNRLVAKVGSGFAKPAGVFEVLPGQEARFLAPQPIRVLPGIGPATERRLQELGIRTLGQIQCLDGALLEECFGRHGAELQRRALGEDERPVREQGDRRAPKSVGHERTFAKDVRDPQVLRGRLQELVEQGLSRLREQGLAARTFSLKLRTADFDTRTRDATLAQPSNLDGDWWPEAVRLLEKELRPGMAVRLLGARFTGLDTQVIQGGLFEDPARVAGRARTELLDRVRARYGEGALRGGERLFLGGEERESADPELRGGGN